MFPALLYNILLSKIRLPEVHHSTAVAGRTMPNWNLSLVCYEHAGASNYPKQQKTFEQFLEEVKQMHDLLTKNQDYPFEDWLIPQSEKRIQPQPAIDTMFLCYSYST